MTLASLYDKLEGLVHKLPQSMQSPILREIGPIRALFLQQRPPRLLLVGDRSCSRSALTNALLGKLVATAEEDAIQTSIWQKSENDRGALRLLDARLPASLSLLRRALAAEPPDACLFLFDPASRPDEIAADLDHARQLAAALRSDASAPPIPIHGVLLKELSEEASWAAREQLQTLLDGPLRRAFGSAGICYVVADDPEELHGLAKAIATGLPDEAKLAMARLSGIREIQQATADSLIKSISALSGLVGTEPIPLADFPILTSLQAVMVAGIMHISGKPLSTKLAAEWIAALGANIGVALAMREGSRALLKFIPIWGDLVSGGIAAAGTYAIGRAASAYFIEGKDISAARRIWGERKKKPVALLK